MSVKDLPVGVSIGALSLKGKATGATIEERFRSLLAPMTISDACFMCRDEDEEFRAVVGGLMLSYDPGSPEFQHIQLEMQMIQQVSAMIQTAITGGTFIPDAPPEGFTPTGLMKLWRERNKF